MSYTSRYCCLLLHLAHRLVQMAIASVGLCGANASGNGDETGVFNATFATQSGGEYLRLTGHFGGRDFPGFGKHCIFKSSKWRGAFPPGF